MDSPTFLVVVFLCSFQGAILEMAPAFSFWLYYALTGAEFLGSGG